MPVHVQVDPTLTRADRLVGQVLGEVGALPDVYTELEINFFLLRRLLGVRTEVGCSFVWLPSRRRCLLCASEVSSLLGMVGARGISMCCGLPGSCMQLLGYNCQENCTIEGSVLF